MYHKSLLTVIFCILVRLMAGGQQIDDPLIWENDIRNFEKLDSCEEYYSNA